MIGNKLITLKMEKEVVGKTFKDSAWVSEGEEELIRLLNIQKNKKG